MPEVEVQDHPYQQGEPYLSEDRAKLITESLVLSTISYMAIMYLQLHSNQKKTQKLFCMVQVLEATFLLETILRDHFWQVAK